MSTIMVDGGRVYILLWRVVERDNSNVSGSEPGLKCSGRRERKHTADCCDLGAVGSLHACSRLAGLLSQRHVLMT